MNSVTVSRENVADEMRACGTKKQTTFVYLLFVYLLFFSFLKSIPKEMSFLNLDL
jgi:hypothetical protein